MARFELPIYGEDEELIKKYEADRVRWGTLCEAAGIMEELKGKDPTTQLAAVSRFMRSIFPSLTDEDLARADYIDIMNTFNQLTNVLGGMKVNELKNG